VRAVCRAPFVKRTFLTTSLRIAQLDELLQLIKSQLASRGPQDQQTTDIARCEYRWRVRRCASVLTLILWPPALPQDLNELNTWMEEFVRNGHSSVDALSDRVAHLQDLIQPPPAATPRLGEDPRGGAPQAGIVGQIAALRDLVIEVRDRQAQAGPQESNQQRLEQLLGSVEVERQHHQQQNSCRSFPPIPPSLALLQLIPVTVLSSLQPSSLSLPFLNDSGWRIRSC
jgi:hypothetical protein